MAEIQMLEVRRGDSRAMLGFRSLTCADFLHEGTRAPGTCLRVYAWERADTVTFGFFDAARRLLSRLSCPESTLRTELALYPVADPTTLSLWFVYHARHTFLEPIRRADPLGQALANLRAARDMAQQGDLVVQVATAVHGAVAALIDQVWAELAVIPIVEPATEASVQAATAIPVRIEPAEAARQRREAFLACGWPTSIQVGAMLGANNPAQRAADLRAAGRLLGAWWAAERTYVHPDCQFGSGGEPLPVMRELLQILPSAGDDGGWRRVFWLYGNRDELEGRSAAELLHDDPRRVLALALGEFAANKS